MSVELLMLPDVDTPVAPVPRLEPRRVNAHVRSASRARLGVYPANAIVRWALRIVLALPIVEVALLVTTAGGPPTATPNTVLLARAAKLGWGTPDVDFVGLLYPPVSTIIAIITPFGAAGLAVVGALVAGFVLQKMVEVLMQRRVHPTVVFGFVIALAVNPLFFYTATQNLPAFLGLSLVALAMNDLSRFAMRGDTQSGFRAGILLMLAALSDGGVILAVLVATLTAPLLSGVRPERGIAFARSVVVLFPALSAFVAIMLLDTLFLHDPLASVARLVDFDPARLAIFPALITTPAGALLVAPVLCAWVLALVTRRLGAVLISLLLFGSVIAGYLFGLIPSQSAGNAFILMLSVAAALTPAVRSIRSLVGLNLLLALQVVIAWESAFSRPIVLDWMTTLWGLIT